MTVHVEIENQQQASAIALKVEQVLARRAERVVRPTITLYDGVVTLTGTCHSWAQKDAVIAIVRGTQGVRLVDDRLRVDPE
jgi:osmotically-inducible protein OsmY